MAGIVDDHESGVVFQREEEERRVSLLDLLRQVHAALPPPRTHARLSS